MEYNILGQSPDGPTLDLDYREFAYAGKFVMSKTGKSVAVEDGSVVGAVAFSPDYDDERVVRFRYVTVRDDRRGEGIGSRLLRYTAESLSAEYDDVTIAVNNPVAYRACYRAGFTFTGHETGIAEVLLRYNPDENSHRERYCEGLARFEDRDLPREQRAVFDREEPPPTVPVPSLDDTAAE